MADISVLQPRATQGSAIQDADGFTVFVFDATISEQHSDDANITEHPVEKGIDVTDHVQLKPSSLVLTGVITATPIDPESLALDAAGLIESGRVAKLYDVLRALHAAKTPVTVITGIRTYENVLLKSIKVPRKGGGRQDIRPTLEFKQVRFVNSVSVPVPAAIVSALKRSGGSSKGKLGKQGASTASASVAAQVAMLKAQLTSTLGSQSVLATLFGGA